MSYNATQDDMQQQAQSGLNTMSSAAKGGANAAGKLAKNTLANRRNQVRAERAAATIAKNPKVFIIIVIVVLALFTISALCREGDIMQINKADEEYHEETTIDVDAYTGN